MRRRIYHTVSVPFLLIAFLVHNRSMAQNEELIETPKDSVVYFDSVPDHSYGAIQVRTIPDSTWKRLKTDEAYWYADLAPERKQTVVQENEPQKNIYNKRWFKVLFWVLIVGAFIALVIWYLASSNILLFRSKPLAISSEEEAITGEDIFTLNYEKEIQKAINEQNFRQAIRLLYLQTLKTLSEHQLIVYKHECTNSDYLFQLKNSSYYKDFFRLTRDFDYTWYGKFDLSPEAFTLMQKDFQTFKQQLQ